MKTLISYINDLKEKTGSDYKIAKLLKTGPSTISMIRTRNQCSDETAIKIADLLEIDRTEVMLAAAIARSEGEAKTVWTKAAERLGVTAGFLLVLLDANALSSVKGLVLYILC